VELNDFMRQAIGEAAASLREGNHGFGAVIVRDGRVIVSAHDREETDGDPTAHAELLAIRAAARLLGKNLRGCRLVSTHEPCPMCAAAVLWAGITEIAYGYSAREAITEGRRRIDWPCAELFARAGAAVRIRASVLRQECSVLYRADVRAEIARLRNADAAGLAALNAASVRRRLEWFAANRQNFTELGGDLPEAGYRLLLARLKISEAEAPVVRRTAREIVFHSRNFCPTLEACRILELDTREVCRRLNENATDALVKQIDPRLTFSRNYAKLRPHSEYCEEMIRLEE